MAGWLAEHSARLEVARRLAVWVRESEDVSDFVRDRGLKIVTAHARQEELGVEYGGGDEDKGGRKDGEHGEAGEEYHAARHECRLAQPVCAGV